MEKIREKYRNISLQIHVEKMAIHKRGGVTNILGILRVTVDLCAGFFEFGRPCYSKLRNRVCSHVVFETTNKNFYYSLFQQKMFFKRFVRVRFFL